MSKQVREKLEKINNLIGNKLPQNTNEITQMLTDLLNSGENFFSKLQENCHLCSSFNIKEHYVRLDSCKHYLDSKCLIQQYLKPTHYRLKEEVMLRLNNIKCPIANCNSIINIKNLLCDQGFRKKLVEKREEFEDKNSFYCHVMLEKVDNFNKLYEKYYEKEVLQVVDKENCHYMYCPFPNCNQFLSFQSGHTHHMIKYCDYCCESLCFECKQSSKECLYFDEIQRGKIIHKKCIISKHELDNTNDEFKSRNCKQCKLTVCGKCRMAFDDDNYNDHFL